MPKLEDTKNWNDLIPGIKEMPWNYDYAQKIKTIINAVGHEMFLYHALDGMILQVVELEESGLHERFIKPLKELTIKIRDLAGEANNKLS